jgi:lipoate-protein ligase B
MPGLRDRRCLCVDLPRLEYSKALDLQRNLVRARHNNVIENDMVLMLEHPPVFSLGRKGDLKNLKVPKAFLEKMEIPVIRVERGGDITFHGPGQLVVYPIIDLNKARLKVMEYVEGLEDIMIRTASDWRITAEKKSVNRGIWVSNNKLGSVGISVRRAVCLHGFALNVNLSLKPFDWIHPCGLRNVGVTSMAQELSREISMTDVRQAVRYHFESFFGFELVMTDLSEVNHLLNPDVALIT